MGTWDRSHDYAVHNCQLTWSIFLHPGSRDKTIVLPEGRWGGWVGGCSTHSCSEFCLCGNGLGPNYSTFCRLSPINGHFLDQSSAQILPAALTAFVPITSLCGLTKMQDLGEDERTSLVKMAHMLASQLPRGVRGEHVWCLSDSSFPTGSAQAHIKLRWYSGSDL